MQNKAQAEIAKLFQKIFAGGDHCFGVHDSSNTTQEYDYRYRAPTLKDFTDHLEGRISMGIVPITRTGLAKFGVIDFDDHHNKPEGYKFNYDLLLKKIKFLNLPLKVFKSKGGGAHGYLFLDKFYKAVDVRHILKKMAYALGEPSDIEIFPKQEQLGSDDKGNFINLPYKGGNSRVLLNLEGKELPMSEGLLYASDRVTNESDWSKFKLLDQGKGQHRNERTFAYAVFAKKHYEDWEQKVKDYNQLFNDPPLGKAPKDHPDRLEKTILSSVRKKDYHDTELEEAPPTELVDYDISDYRRLDIKQPKFITERLFKERSINFIFGEKGKGKTEICLGFANAMC